MTVPDAIVLVDTKLQEMLDEFGDGVSGVSREWQGSVLKFRFSPNPPMDRDGRREDSGRG